MQNVEAIYNNPKNRALLDAVVINDIESTKALLAQLEDKSFIENIGLLSRPFPLYYISLCNEVIWREVDEYNDKEMARRNRDESLAMVEFWKEYLGVNDLGAIDYRYYRDDLYYYCPGDDTTDNDILLIATTEDYIKCGSREIDISLLCAVARLDFEKVRHLLERGANPDVDLHFTPIETRTDTDEPDNVFSIISSRCAYLSTEHCCVLREFRHNRLFQGHDILEYLLDLAALNEMYRLLDKYVKK